MPDLGHVEIKVIEKNGLTLFELAGIPFDALDWFALADMHDYDREKNHRAIVVDADGDQVGTIGYKTYPSDPHSGMCDLFIQLIRYPSEAELHEAILGFLSQLQDKHLFLGQIIPACLFEPGQKIQVPIIPCRMANATDVIRANVESQEHLITSIMYSVFNHLYDFNHLKNTEGFFPDDLLADMKAIHSLSVERVKSANFDQEYFDKQNNLSRRIFECLSQKGMVLTLKKIESQEKGGSHA